MNEQMFHVKHSETLYSTGEEGDGGALRPHASYNDLNVISYSYHLAEVAGERMGRGA